jgi:hypothetical protein
LNGFGVHFASFAPLGRPLSGDASVTLPLGYRADPFLGGSISLKGEDRSPDDRRVREQ